MVLADLSAPSAALTAQDDVITLDGVTATLTEAARRPSAGSTPRRRTRPGESGRGPHRRCGTPRRHGRLGRRRQRRRRQRHRHGRRLGRLRLHHRRCRLDRRRRPGKQPRQHRLRRPGRRPRRGGRRGRGRRSGRRPRPAPEAPMAE
ncbi:hypothetical protein ACFQV4_06370 [Streptomyces thermocarboxydus]